VKLKVTNPANGEVAATLDADDPRSVRAKYMQSRAAQPGWARTPLKKRLEAIARFRDLVARESDRLARVLTTEVGKPIAQSRNELKGLLPRIDFFLEETARTLKPEKVSADAAMEERITHEPLGVVANISAWNYPWFVGSNVFVPALLAGNTVLVLPTVPGIAPLRNTLQEEINDFRNRAMSLLCVAGLARLWRHARPKFVAENRTRSGVDHWPINRPASA